MIGTVIAKIGASVLLLPCSFLLLLYLESYVIYKKFQFCCYSAHLEMCLYDNIIDTKYCRVVTKISSCRLNTASRRGIKRLGISFGSIFALFSNKSSQGPLS